MSSAENSDKQTDRDSEVKSMKIQFDEKVLKIVEAKNGNSCLFTKEKYESLIKEVKEAKQKEVKTTLDYRRLNTGL